MIGIIAVVFVGLAVLETVATGWLFVALVRWYRREGLFETAFAEVGQFAAQQAAERLELVSGAAAQAGGCGQIP